MKVYIYKATRNDGLEYIGITNNPSQRYSQHKRSKRFLKGLKEFKILEETTSYKKAEEKEEYYIKYYDTYNNGLNVTPNGKGKNGDVKFNTLGFSFSENSKRKMKENHWSRKGGVCWIKGKRHTEETKKKISDKTKGYCRSKRKISIEKAREIINAFENDIISFDNEYIKKIVKKSHQDLVGIIPFEDLVLPNGKKITKITLYSKYYSEKLNVDKNCIRQIILGKRVFAPDAK